MRRVITILMAATALIAAGCASKGYVREEVEASETRTAVTHSSMSVSVKPAGGLPVNAIANARPSAMNASAWNTEMLIRVAASCIACASFG